MPKPKTALEALFSLVMTEDAARVREQSQEKILDAFRCPLTGEIMTDPVVHPSNGISFQNGFKLQEKIHNNPKFKLKQGQNLLPNPKLRTLIQGFMNANPNIAARESKRTIINSFRCPLTGKIMTNPVLHPNPVFQGRNFENGPKLQEKILKDPRYKLEPGQTLIPNPSLLDLMARYKMMNPSPAPW